MTTRNSLNITLIDRFMRGETSQEEESQLLEWLRSPISREEILSFYKQKWIETSAIDLPMEVQERMFLKIKARMHEVEQARINNERKIPIRKRRYTTYWLSYAAAILFCVGITSYFFINQNKPVINNYIVAADKGQRASVTLPDGTKVWLNSHTEIKYGSDYGIKERAIHLSGEAYFEVAKDKTHRFVVKVGEMEVEALGTSFNVKAYEEDEELTATLFTGSIRATVGDKFFILSPNQHVLFNRESRELSVGKSFNSSYARMWRNNELAFEGETLGDIAILINRIYNVQVAFKSEEIKQYRFSGVIKNNSLDNIIEIISLTAPIIYESHGDTIILSEKP